MFIIQLMQGILGSLYGSEQFLMGEEQYSCKSISSLFLAITCIRHLEATT
jgi:hypothetical protein